MTRTILKKKRHEYLLRKIKQNPFLKDEELAQACNVSVSTIRFDRAELGIAEYRERIKSVAEEGLVADTAWLVKYLTLTCIMTEYRCLKPMIR